MLLQPNLLETMECNKKKMRKAFCIFQFVSRLGALESHVQMLNILNFCKHFATDDIHGWGGQWTTNEENVQKVGDDNDGDFPRIDFGDPPSPS